MKWGANRLEQIRKGQDEAAANRRRLAERWKAKVFSSSAAEAKPVETAKRPLDLDIEQALVAAQQLRLMPLERAALTRGALNRPTLRLIELFLLSLKTGRSQAVLQWPTGESDLSLIHPLAMLATLGASPPRSDRGYSWCNAVRDFRTLYYPWRGGATGAVQSKLLIDRHEVLDRNRYHLTRQSVHQPEISRELGWLHETLAHLYQLRLKDAAKPHLAHPTLGEIYPSFAAEGGDLARFAFAEPVEELFGRVRHGAGLTQILDHRGALCRPQSAPFAMFNVSNRIDQKRALANPVLLSGRGGRPPDICLVDLGPPALSRLGHSWRDQLEEFLEAVRTQFGDVPTFGVTRDSFVYGQLEKLLDPRAEGAGRRVPGAVGSALVLRRSGDILTPDPAISTVSPVQTKVHSAAGAGSEALKVLSDAARGTRDPVLAGKLRHAMGGLRRQREGDDLPEFGRAERCPERGDISRDDDVPSAQAIFDRIRLAHAP